MRARKILLAIILLTLLGLWVDLPAQINWQQKIGSRTLAIHWRKPRFQWRLGPWLIKSHYPLRQGLDLAGGVHLVFQAQMAKVATKDRARAWAALAANIHRRVDAFGLGEVAVRQMQAGKDYRLIVDIPGNINPRQAVDLIGQTAQLDFRLATFPKGKMASTAASLRQLFAEKTGLNGAYLQSARVEFDRQSGKPYIGLTFNKEGGKRFAAITQKNVHRRLAIFLDNLLLMAPEIKEPILNGQAMISGNFSLKEARQIAAQLNAGALPVPLKLIEQQRISPSLGQESVRRALTAGIVGIAIESFFMVAVYGWLGFLALLGLAVYGILSFMLYKLLPVTVTMPGIAGFLLSLGMAVDANILIFERMKEELRAGQPWRQAMELGFGRAWDSIRDANACTLITAFILFNPFDWSFLNTSGMVRGFALTLGLGVLLELFTSIVVVRAIMRVLYHRRQT